MHATHEQHMYSTYFNALNWFFFYFFLFFLNMQCLWVAYGGCAVVGCYAGDWRQCIESLGTTKREMEKNQGSEIRVKIGI